MYRKIKMIRERRGISLGELAEKTGIPKSTLQRYETGTTKKIPQSAITLLSEVFGEKLYEEDYSEDERRDISLMLKKFLHQLEGEALMFDGEVLDDETRHLLKTSIESTLETSMRMSKLVAKSKQSGE